MKVRKEQVRPGITYPARRRILDGTPLSHSESVKLLILFASSPESYGSLPRAWRSFISGVKLLLLMSDCDVAELELMKNWWAWRRLGGIAGFEKSMAAPEGPP